MEKNPSPELSFLRDHSFLYLMQGQKAEYCLNRGSSAAIFKAVKGKSQYAIRCFLDGDWETFRRWEDICQYLTEKDLPWKVPCEYLDMEIRVGSEEYPAIKMEWTEGMHLNQYIDRIISQPHELSALQQKLVNLSYNLEENGIGHGDLNFSHIVLVKEKMDYQIKLLDYTTLFIPPFFGKQSREAVTPGFQHPGRLSTDFSETMDRFSIWVMLTALEALKLDRGLWEEYRQTAFEGKNLLFTYKDLTAPAQSVLFKRLQACNHEPLNHYLNHLLSFCGSKFQPRIDRPEIFKRTRSPFTENAPTSLSITTAPVYDMEIRTNPSGKDVLVRGTKKGITPLRLSLSKKDFPFVEVVSGTEHTPVSIDENKSSYEIDLSRSAPATETEPNEIIEFGADKYWIEEGEPGTIHWKVNGHDKIHISHIGEVPERTGRKIVVLKNTTNYVLTVGSKKSSLTIHVQPKRIQGIPAPKRSTSQLSRPVRKRSKKLLYLPAALILLVMAYFFLPSLLTKTDRDQLKQNAISKAPEEPLFTKAGMTDFLNSLYGSYNKRDLPSILGHYADRVNTYYNSRSISRDSLGAIMKDLFITPAYYNCKPDLNSLVLQPGNGNCSLQITLYETLKKDSRSKKENFSTTIQYQIDSSFHIISESRAE